MQNYQNINSKLKEKIKELEGKVLTMSSNNSKANSSGSLNFNLQPQQQQQQQQQSNSKIGGSSSSGYEFCQQKLIGRAMKVDEDSNRRPGQSRNPSL